MLWSATSKVLFYFRSRCREIDKLLKKDDIITPQNNAWINRGRVKTKIRQVNSIIIFIKTQIAYQAETS